MHSENGLKLQQTTLDLDRPTLLFESDHHAVYWLGITEETTFRCNVYLITDGDEGIIIDPGSRIYFEQVRSRVAQVMAPERLSAMVLCHQDPDVAASMVDWLTTNPKMTVITSPRAHVLLPHYGVTDYTFHDIEQTPQYTFASGNRLRFITAPFLHSPAAFASYDEASRCLFSGDIWAAITTDWTLAVEDFEAHALNMDMFHMDYMASNIAARGFAAKLNELEIAAILSQHGSIIGPEHVPAALDYLRSLRCGTDIAYPDLS